MRNIKVDSSDKFFNVSNDTIVTLNDDCLLTIFTWLEFKDQLTMAKLCERFKLLLQQYIWATQYKSVLLNFYVDHMSIEDFHDYVNCIFPLAKEIRIKGLSSKHVDILKRCNFPNVCDFRFSQQRPYFMDDEDLLTFNAIFPNLYTFSPQGRFTGRYLVRFHKLRHLTLTYCQGLHVAFICKALSELELSTLKLNTFDTKLEPLGERVKYFQRLVKIVMNKIELAWLYEYDNPEWFCHLEELIITDMLNEREALRLFSLLSRRRTTKIQSVEIANSSCVCRLTNDFVFSFYEHMKKIAFVNVNDSLNVKLYEKFQALRELHFHSCMIEDESSVLDLLKLDLDILNIEKCTTGFDVLDIDVESVTRRRKRPLTFNFCNNLFINIEPVIMNVRGKQNHLLKLTELLSNNVNYEPFKIVFE